VNPKQDPGRKTVTKKQQNDEISGLKSCFDVWRLLPEPDVVFRCLRIIYGVL
jgi:hypothetical protein